MQIIQNTSIIWLSLLSQLSISLYEITLITTTLLIWYKILMCWIREVLLLIVYVCMYLLYATEATYTLLAWFSWRFNIMICSYVPDQPSMPTQILPISVFTKWWSLCEMSCELSMVIYVQRCSFVCRKVIMTNETSTKREEVAVLWIETFV